MIGSRKLFAFILTLAALVVVGWVDMPQVEVVVDGICFAVGAFFLGNVGEHWTKRGGKT